MSRPKTYDPHDGTHHCIDCKVQLIPQTTTDKGNWPRFRHSPSTGRATKRCRTCDVALRKKQRALEKQRRQQYIQNRAQTQAQ